MAPLRAVGSSAPTACEIICSRSGVSAHSIQLQYGGNARGSALAVIATQPASSPSRQCMMCTWKLRTANFQSMTAKQPKLAAMMVLLPIRPASGMRCQIWTDDALNDMKDTKRMNAPRTLYTPPLPCMLRRNQREQCQGLGGCGPGRRKAGAQMAAQSQQVTC